ncbi:MAG: nitrogenase component 1 [Methanomicrobiales archaeon]|nr:nitrogenase component 1 [Methanomicrobiales archaeon]MDI6875319.1 nitrogenase component 1 [Methanomicrobiales archaeon]
MSTHRYDGCTLSGALSVTTQVIDGVTIVHGPAGCAHHNFSLLHATLQENEYPFLPRILSTNLDEGSIIFGGEEALEDTIRTALAMDPRSIFVVSTCIADTIGDDVGGVCAADWGVPVIHIPTSGFFGGAFHHGFLQSLLSLLALSGTEASTDTEKTVNLIGEKNLEYEVEENYREVARLLSALGLEVRVRYVRNISTRMVAQLGNGALNILRDPGIAMLGSALASRFGTPFLPAFPVGLQGTLEFIASTADILGIDSTLPQEQERAHQEEMLQEYADLAGERISLQQKGSPIDIEPASLSLAQEIVPRLGMHLDDEGTPVPLPVSAPVGTAGVRRMLHRWRRALHA